MSKKGFTLIEILVVATIVALLTAIATVSYSQFGKQSRDARRKIDIEQIRSALEMYRSNEDKYYDTVNFNNRCNVIGWLGSYISTIPDDPKSSSNYYYRCIIYKNNYTVAAFLETGGPNSCSACKSGVACNYCLGPYGEL